MASSSLSIPLPLLPSSGQWKPNGLQALYYGPHCIKNNLLSSLPNPSSSKAFIITTSSLAQSPSLTSITQLLGSQHAGTFASISAHAPISSINQAARTITDQDAAIDTIISLGGGSPIDSAKAISHRLHEKTGRWLFHIAIPTTLSAAECTHFAGFSDENGVKTLLASPELAPRVIFYDAEVIAGSTPGKLWLSTGIRALDHAVETWYRDDTPTAPTRGMVFCAIRDLFEFLPKSKLDPQDRHVITRLQLASFQSLWPYGLGMKGGLGLSHSLGYALGSPYGIPHGITSCLTLGKVVKLRAEEAGKATLLAQLRAIVGEGDASGDDREDAIAVGEAIEGLVQRLGLETDLNEYKVEQSELDVIVERGTGGDKGELANKVRILVKSLWNDGG